MQLRLTAGGITEAKLTLNRTCNVRSFCSKKANQKNNEEKIIILACPIIYQYQSPWSVLKKSNKAYSWIKQTSKGRIFQGLQEILILPIQFPKAGQWWSNPSTCALQILQYLTLLCEREFWSNQRWKQSIN